MPPADPPPGEFVQRLSTFASRLRGLGLTAGPGETAAAARALETLPLLSLTEIRDALRMILTAHQREQPTFDAAFREHFLRPAENQEHMQPSGVNKPPSGAPPPAQSPEQEQRAPDAPASEPPPDPEAEPAGLAGRKGQARTDLPPELEEAQPLRTRLSPHAGRSEGAQGYGGELEQLLAAASALIRGLRLGRSRRWKPAPSGSRFDVRRTLHAALRTAGDPVSPRYQAHPLRSPRFLIVLDGSRSMAPYSALLLRYAAALMLRTRRAGAVEVYSFSTTLTRLTPLLRHSLERARFTPGSLGAWTLDLPDLGEAWGGGTRIGENLLRLSQDERARLSPGTVTLILSDGLDTGEPALLARAARELRRRSGRLIWLNPLAGMPGYLPLARGMAAALPHLDVFAAAGGVAELEALPARLARR